MDLTIAKTTNFSAELTVTADQPAYVQFNGSVDATGKPNVNFYINDMGQYMAHLNDFMNAFSAFQKAVFDYSKQLMDDLAQANTGQSEPEQADA